MPSFDPSVNVLLIEDDIVDIMDIKRMFKKNNINNPLYIAMNGLEALTLLREKKNNKATIPKPCVILLDLNMPKMNGIEFLHVLRADPNLHSTLVFVLTSSNAEQDKIDTYNLNIAGYIVKPMQLENFTRAIAILNDYLTLLAFPSATEQKSNNKGISK